MKRSIGRFGRTAIVGQTTAGVLAVTACASMIGRGAIDTERTLAAAGFQMKLADTPEKLTHLGTLEPQRKLVSYTQDGETRYVWADGKYCKCLYAGSEQAYQRYQNLAIQQKLGKEQLLAAEANEEAAIEWATLTGVPDPRR